MIFLVGTELDCAIHACMATSDARCAVAFLGKGARALFRTGVRARIVCNLLAGGTNPHEIKWLSDAGHDVRQHDHLHAKVYVGGNKAVITSANLSSNGLGLEADEQAHWIEAGAVTDEVEPVTAWFDRLWRDPETRTITPQDIKDALVKWRDRRFGKPTLRTFAAFDAEATDFPLLYDWFEDDFQINKKVVKDLLGATGDQAYTIIGNSLDVHDEKDMPLMEPGRWVLWWRTTRTSMPHSSAVLQWGKIGKRVPKVVRYDKGSWRDCILTDLDARPAPFNCKDQTFSRLFKATLSQNEFGNLRRSVDTGPFFHPRIELTQSFWRTLKKLYTPAKP